jgi:hypothetical protein
MILIALVDFFALKYRQAKRKAGSSLRFEFEDSKRMLLVIIPFFFLTYFFKNLLHPEYMIERIILEIFYFRNAAQLLPSPGSLILA